MKQPPQPVAATTSTTIRQWGATAAPLLTALVLLPACAGSAATESEGWAPGDEPGASEAPPISEQQTTQGTQSSIVTTESSNETAADMEQARQALDTLAAELDDKASDTDALSFEEFRNAHRVPGSGESEYVVEGDILVDDLEQLRAYYYTEYLTQFVEPDDKLIVDLVQVTIWPGITVPVRDIRADGVINYCYVANWNSLVYDTNGDSLINTADIPTKTLSSVQTPLERGMRLWEDVAKVRFVHLDNMDGASCAPGVGGVDIAVSHYNDAVANRCVALGPFPKLADQTLKVPLSDCGFGEELAIHELGHVLGFRHEHIHSADPNRCSESGPWEELFPTVDLDSAMIYLACGIGPDGVPGTVDDFAIAGNDVSAMDGIGARIVYGPPDWWWAGL